MNALQNVDNIVVGIMALVGIILAVERVAKWIIEKFNLVHNQVNEIDHLKETLNSNTEDVACLKDQNSLMIDALRNILRRQLIADALKYIAEGELTHDQLEEYEVTYKIYANMGGNGIGTKYHEDVIKLPVKPKTE